MKQPRLPGAEKFKFSTSEKALSSEHVSISSLKNRLSTSNQSPERPLPSHHMHQSQPYRSESNGELVSTFSAPVLNRADSKRRAVLPVTCKKTSRMLNNTNLELNVDPDLICVDAVKPRLDSTRVPSCPNLETSSRSLNASKTSLDTYFRKMSLQNPSIREISPEFDWKNIRASPSRLSVSCSSTCSSEEDIWVLREKS